jgi:hypothetical protein
MTAITGVYGSGIAPGGPAYVGNNGRLQPPSAEVSSGLCAGQTAGVTDWRINEIAQLSSRMRRSARHLKSLRQRWPRRSTCSKAGCPTDLPSTPTGRIEAMRVRLSAMLEAVRTVRAPLAKFFSGRRHRSLRASRRGRVQILERILRALWIRVAPIAIFFWTTVPVPAPH